MPALAENPPRNTSQASQGCPAASGISRTILTGEVLGWPSRTPPSAMGMAKTHIARKYSGRTQIAVRRWSSLEFSTTDTWNCRGRKRISAAESRSCETQVVGDVAGGSTSGGHPARAFSKISPAPPKRPQQTNTPRASRATSFTPLSATRASTIPGWRSVGLTRRMPSTIVKATISRAMSGPTPALAIPCARGECCPEMTATDSIMLLNWSER
ncbi:MAG: hypothetical protein QM765_36330 [Myxococcales bacterium]